jgi:TPR repeat protein
MEMSKLNLQEAAKLGHQEALLELAEKYGDPAFFEQTTCSANENPSWVAEIAELMGRPEDAQKWLTEAAKQGDTEAMLHLIDNYDHEDLQQCWTWVYLAQLLGVDFTKDKYVAIHEDGSLYDDDVGGPMFVNGRDGLKLELLSKEQDTTARRMAQAIYEDVQQLTK